MRPTCVAITYDNGSVWFMPSESEPRERCGKPAVDFQESGGKKYWLCAEHWDRVRVTLPGER